METHDLEQRIFEKLYQTTSSHMCCSCPCIFELCYNYAVGYKLVYVHHSHAVAIILGCYWASFNWSY